MPLNLTTPTAISATIDRITLTAFTLDLENRQLHIAYDEIDTTGTVTVNRDKLLTISGPEFTAFRQRFEAQSRPTKWRDLRRTIFEAIRDEAGRPGSIDDTGD